MELTEKLSFVLTLCVEKGCLHCRSDNDKLLIIIQCSGALNFVSFDVQDFVLPWSHILILFAPCVIGSDKLTCHHVAGWSAFPTPAIVQVTQLSQTLSFIKWSLLLLCTVKCDFFSLLVFYWKQTSMPSRFLVDILCRCCCWYFISSWKNRFTLKMDSHGCVTVL